MSTCQICGADNAQWTHKTRSTLCADCAKDTPAKISYAAFCVDYFDGESVHAKIAREFYEDYLASRYSLPEYIQKTTSPA